MPDARCLSPFFDTPLGPVELGCAAARQNSPQPAVGCRFCLPDAKDRVRISLSSRRLSHGAVLCDILAVRALLCGRWATFHICIRFGGNRFGNLSY